jgi:hypothetical protein
MVDEYKRALHCRLGRHEPVAALVRNSPPGERPARRIGGVTVGIHGGTAAARGLARRLLRLVDSLVPTKANQS